MQVPYANGQVYPYQAGTSPSNKNVKMGQGANRLALSLDASSEKGERLSTSLPPVQAFTCFKASNS